MSMILNDVEIAPGATWREDVGKGDGCAFLPSLDVGSMELLGDLGRSSEGGIQSIKSSRLPVSGRSAKKGEGGIFIDAKLNALKIRSTKMELGEFSNPNGLPKLMVPPTGGSTGKWEGREAMGASETPRGGPRPAEALDFLPREADDASWARKGVNKGPIKDHDLFPDSGEGHPKGGMSCEKAAETMNTKVRYGSFGVDAVLFGEQNPDKFLSTSPPTMAPESR
jgi:hypothetical protein